MPRQPQIPFSSFKPPQDGRLAEARNTEGDLVEVIHPRIMDSELVDFIRESRGKGLTVMIFPQ